MGHLRSNSEATLAMPEGASQRSSKEEGVTSSATEDSSSASASDEDAQASAPTTSSSPKAAKAAAKSPRPKAKAKAASSTSSSSQVLKPPSPKAERRRSSNSLVPKELQGVQEGADFEAAKVRRAVKAAAQRVKARKNPRAKKKVTSRSELLACLFNALGGYETNYLRSGQLLRMAWLLGFEGGETEWEKEYVVLCRSYNWNPNLGASRRQFAELLADEDSDAYSNDMEVATMLSNLRVQAPKQLPRDHLVKEFFNWADADRNGRLGRGELLRFAKHLGFQGSAKDWDKEYEYMARRYHWGSFFGGFRDSRDGCDLSQFSRMLADTEGSCFCDEEGLQVELAELEMATCRPYFSRMVNKEVLQADEEQQRKSAVLIQELWRGRLRARALLRDLRAMLLNKKELKRLLEAEDELKLRMAKAAARIWKWWKPFALRRKWLRTLAGLRAAKKTRERQMKEAKRKEELKARRLKELSDLQDAETRREENIRIRASLMNPEDVNRLKVKSEQEKKKELVESRDKAKELQDFRGLLMTKCSTEEAMCRQRERLLDPLEVRKGCDLRRPEVDFHLACKKYQRSSAGKIFQAEEETMTFLTDFVLEADIYNDIFASTPSFEEIYSYLHDRCRAVRIDLHLQQPWSSRTQEFVTCHEYCLRFEILANILFREKDVNKSIYDPHLGLQAISQTIDPLLAAYQDARERGQAFDTEAPIRRLVILLLLATSPELLPMHLAALDRNMLEDPLILSAVKACSDFLSGHYCDFLRFVDECHNLDFYILMDLADLARIRLLWLRARAYPKAVGDRWPLEALAKLLRCDCHMLRSLLAAYEVEIDEAQAEAILPLKDAWITHPLCCELPKEEKYRRITSSKFVEGRKPKDWKQICLPWSDTWEESAHGIIRKEGISMAMESDRFEVLNCKGVPFSMRDRRLQAQSGRRLVLKSDFPMLLNIKVWTLQELQRRLKQPDKELRQSQASLQKQIEQLKRGRPGKLMDPSEKLKLERLRQEEVDLQVRAQETRGELERMVQNRACLMLQAIVRGCRARKAQLRRREAAKVLQRGWRGYLSRLRLENLKALARQRVKQVKHVRNAEISIPSFFAMLCRNSRCCMLLLKKDFMSYAKNS
eukprot:symbB.v1.2.003548.t2/scaffold196.1/size274459/20